MPLLNASLTDCVFEVERPTDVDEINGAFKRAADGALSGILGYEERPLVSVDYKDDTRSAIVDALSTMVVDGTCVKVLAWYDNEIGYVHRMIELAQKVGPRSADASTIGIRNYAIVTAAYWAFTLTDGALRMLVLLHFQRARLHARRSSRFCSSSTNSSASSRIWSAAGWRRAPGCG